MNLRENIERLALSDGLRMPDKLEAIVALQEDASLQSPGVPAHYYRFFFRLFRELSPKFSLELGTSYGHSSACMADGNPNGVVITVNNAVELIESCRRDNVIYRYHDSLEKIPLDFKIDVLFIDTNHDGIFCFKEFDLYKDDVAEDGIVFFDDIFLFKCMSDFWINFNPEGWEKFELPVHGGAGFGCLIRKR